MQPELTPKQIGKRIQRWRKLKGYSQEDIARLLGLPRSSVTQMESGNRQVTVNELITISENLHFSLDEFLLKDNPANPETEKIHQDVPPKQKQRISLPKLKPEKVKNIVLYLLERCGGKPNVGETVLYKLLYFIDFNYYELYEEHLSGIEYCKLPYGPVPKKLDSIISQMIGKGAIQQIKAIYHTYPQTRYIPMEKADLTRMTAAEKEVIDRVADQFSDWSAAAISEYSHKDIPWIATEDGDVIDYELAFYRESPFSARTYAEDYES